MTRSGAVGSKIAVRSEARFAAAVLILVAARGAGTEVLGGRPASAGASPDLDAWLACTRTDPQSPECRARRAVAVPAPAEDLETLGAAGNLLTVQLLAGTLATSEPELRAAAAKGIGMIGPTPAETEVLAAALNDPVPAVRLSARTTLSTSRDARAQALAGRALRTNRWKGFATEHDPDLGKFGIPSDSTLARLRRGSQSTCRRAPRSSRAPIRWTR